MNFVDEQVRLEVNTHGGVVIHFQETDRHPAFFVWNTLGGRWAIGDDRFDHLSDACWSKMHKNEKGEVTRAEMSV